jgi:hypothetical protein
MGGTFEFAAESQGWLTAMDASTGGGEVEISNYNFCRVHQTLRVTPAMEAGLTDHAWSIMELLSMQATITD